MTADQAMADAAEGATPVDVTVTNLSLAFSADEDGTVAAMAAALPAIAGTPAEHHIEGLYVDFLARRRAAWFHDAPRDRVVFGVPGFMYYDPGQLIVPLERFADGGDTAHRHLARGMVDHLQGRADSARAAFGRAAERGQLQRMMLGAHTASRPDHAPLDFSGDFTIHKRHDQPVTVLVACDARYFRAFVGPFRRSLAGLGVGIHFHVINPDANVDVWVAEPWVGFSSETAPLRDGRADPTWLATCRFLRAEAIMEAYGTPVLISDIDCTLKMPMARLLEVSARRDVTVSIAPWAGSHVPWRTVVAAATWVNPTSNGRRFLGDLADRVRRRFTPDDYPRTWWFDQQVLFEAAAGAPSRPGRFPRAVFTPVSTHPVKSRAKATF